MSDEIDRPIQASTVVSFASPLRPHRPRGVTWSVGSEVADRVREAARVAVRDLGAELGPQLRQRAGPLLDERASQREDGLEVDALDAARPGPVREQLTVEESAPAAISG